MKEAIKKLDDVYRIITEENNAFNLNINPKELDKILNKLDSLQNQIEKINTN